MTGLYGPLESGMRQAAAPEGGANGWCRALLLRSPAPRGLLASLLGALTLGSPRRSHWRPDHHADRRIAIGIEATLAAASTRVRASSRSRRVVRLRVIPTGGDSGSGTAGT